MARTTKTENYSMEFTLSAIAKGVTKKDFDAAKRSFNELISNRNAYKCADLQPWHMITYKKGRKSSL